MTNDESAAKSAEAAKASATHAATSASEATSAAEDALLLARLVKLEVETARLAAAEILDSTETSTLQTLVGTMQSQMLWITCGAVLVGAAVDHVLTAAFL